MGRLAFRPRLRFPSLAAMGAGAWGGLVRVVLAVWAWLNPPARRIVMRPYARPLGALRTGPMIIVLLFFCLVWGIAFALFAPFLVVPLMAPLVLVGLLVLWALPSTDKPPVKLLDGLFVAFFIASALWPNYLAPNVPGVPRMSLQRLLNIPMSLVLLVCISTSASFRKELAHALKSSGWLSKSVIAFCLVELFSIIISSAKADSFITYINILPGWFGGFFTAIYVFSRPGRVTRFAVLFCATTLCLCLLSVAEWRMQKVIWAGHIPAFLQISDPNIATILAGDARIGKEAHRVQGPFNTALTLSELLALCMPFLLHFVMESYTRWVRIGAALMIPVLTGAILLTQSRTGVLGILIAFALFPAIRLGIFWLRNRHNLAASAAIFVSPFVGAAGLVAAYMIPALHNRIFGGGGEQFSNQGRADQMSMGIPKVLSHPWGYGIGQGAEVLGYTNGRGGLTIDSYPLRLTLEIGVGGVLLYYAMNLLAAGFATKIAISVDPKDKEFMMAISLGVAVLSFLAMQINFALEDNQPFIFMMYGAIAGLMARYRPATG
jgi:hypothetical protein